MSRRYWNGGAEGDPKTTSEVDLFSMPSEFHISAPRKLTINLDNEIMHTSKDAENSHEKDIEFIDVLGNEESRPSSRDKSHYNNEVTDQRWKKNPGHTILSLNHHGKTCDFRTTRRQR